MISWNPVTANHQPNYSRPASFRIDWDANPSGPWKIIAYIPKADLAKAEYQNTAAKSHYPYQFVDMDEQVKTGYTYWYYVAAFDNESGTVAGVRSPAWKRTKTTGTAVTAAGTAPTICLRRRSVSHDRFGWKEILGANFVLQPPRVTAATLIKGEKKIMVKPNPYKVQAPHDVGLEHKIQFYN
jgi:hypothetical protein